MNGIATILFLSKYKIRKQNRTPSLQVVFKEVVPISDRGVVAKIHQSYRLGCAMLCCAALCHTICGPAGRLSAAVLPVVGRVMHTHTHTRSQPTNARPSPPPRHPATPPSRYVKDVVLPRVLDDATFATLSSLILFNNVEVCF